MPTSVRFPYSRERQVKEVGPKKRYSKSASPLECDGVGEALPPHIARVPAQLIALLHLDLCGFSPRAECPNCIPIFIEYLQ